jgi:sialic acid synthase SpsE
MKSYAEEQSILFLSTPDEEDSADFLAGMGVAALKIGSGEVTNLPYLRHAAGLGRPIILSTGMSSLAEVEAAVRTIEAAGNQALVLLHCVSNYPADAGDCNLRAMQTLAQAFGVPVGFSDHTLGIEVAVAAVALGAQVIEKHLTLDKSLPGPDQAASLVPEEFAAMVKAIRSVERALGDGIKRPTGDELATKRVVQKSWVAARNLSAGQRLEPGDVMLRRGEPGLAPADLKWVIGRQLRQDLAAGAPINLDLFQ